MRIRLQVRGEVSGQGFPITMFIEENGKSEAIPGYLPVIPPTLQSLCEQWRNGYLGVDEIALRLTPRPDVEQVSIDALRSYARQLGIEVNQWLDSGGGNWQNIRDHLNGCSPRSKNARQPVELFLEIEDDRLTRIPWQEWQFLEKKFPETELVFNGWGNYGSRNSLVPPQSGTPVRILVVVGNTVGIEAGIQSDVEALQELEKKGAKITVLKQPSRQQLLNCLWDETYDIFVFTGHSGSDSAGRIGWLELNRTDQFDVEDLTGALQESIKKGLQICIFNSCDGLGLAHQLAELRVPVTIVMREPVPDEVAARFLRIFLERFSEKRSLFRAFWQARQRIRGEFNSQYPGVRWLPKIFMGVPKTPPTWKQLGGKSSKRIAWKRRLIPAIGSIVLIVAFMFGIFYREPILTSLSSLVGNFNFSDVSSEGEQNLLKNDLPGEYGTLKAEGIKAFKEKRYIDAEKQFRDLRDRAKKVIAEPSSKEQDKDAARKALKDFETLIYRNNAQAFIQSGEPGGKPVRRIAAVSPVTREEGQQIFFGIAQAQQKVVDNREVNLVILVVDDANTIQRSRDIAQAISNQEEEVLAVVGHYTTPNTCAALNSYSPKKLAVVSSTSTVVDIRESQSCGDVNKVFFRTASNTLSEALTLRDALRESQRRGDIILFYRKDERFSEDLLKQFSGFPNIKGRITDEINLSDSTRVEQFLNTQRDRETQLNESVVLAVFPDGKTVDGDNESPAFQNAIKVIKSTKGKNLILGANTLVLEEVLSSITNDMIGNEEKNAVLNQLILAVDWTEEDQSANRIFVRNAQIEWGGEINRRTAQSYEAVQVLAKIIESEATREGVLQKLRGVRESEIPSNVFQSKSISFDPKGDRKEISERILVKGTLNSRNGQLRFTPVRSTSSSATQ